MRKFVGWVIFAGLLIYLALPWKVIFGQASAGYSLIGTVNAPTLTFTDSTCPVGSSCSYEVTATDTAGESIPAATPSGATQVTQSPGPNGKIILTWIAPAMGTPPVSYKVYTAARVPNPPTGLAAVSN